jgi:hypothetical protein
MFLVSGISAHPIDKAGKPSKKPESSSAIFLSYNNITLSGFYIRHIVFFYKNVTSSGFRNAILDGWKLLDFKFKYPLKTVFSQRTAIPFTIYHSYLIIVIF